jgi:glycosyltransferase involved in cell wall biosynthesis
MVSVVIVAFNEARTVGYCVTAALQCPSAHEVIVVDDGSTDKTAEVAASAGATKVVRLEQNSGKAAAMAAGVRVASHDIILFLDADVTGLTPQMLSRIVQPVVDERFEMYVGVRARETIWLNKLLHFAPIIGGERAVTRRLWDAVPSRYREGFKIEIALNHTAKQFEHKMGFELIAGTVHRIKERKYGLITGLLRRTGMIVDILIVSFQIYIWDTAVKRSWL